jgi:putative salt-induced outer membrane protein YdiY
MRRGETRGPALPCRDRRAGVAVALACAAIVQAAPAWAQKVDTTVLDNGNRITCEIKSLDRGRLRIGTDALETVTVYWQRVVAVASPRLFEVEIDDGARYFGALQEAAPGRVRVAAPGAAPIELALVNIVHMMPLEARFWQKLDGNIDLGFSFAKANLETRWTLNSEVDYRSRHYSGKLVLASQLTAREDADTLSRQAVSLMGNRALANRWFALSLGQVQQNEELSLELRYLVGGGGGRDFLQSNSSLFRVYSGLVYTHEKFSSTDPQSSPELAAGFHWDWFTARNDALDLSVGVVSFYNLGGNARARVESQSALRFEFLKDFYFSVNGYQSYDSDPPTTTVKADYGVNAALGWKF